MTSTLPYRQVRQKALAGHNAMPTTRLVLISPLALTRRFQEVIERLARGCSRPWGEPAACWKPPSPQNKRTNRDLFLRPKSTRIWLLLWLLISGSRNLKCPEIISA